MQEYLRPYIWLWNCHSKTQRNQFSTTYKSPLHIECIEIWQFTDCVDLGLKCSFGLTEHCGCQDFIPILATNQIHCTNKNFSTLLKRCWLPCSECFLTDINCLCQTCLLHKSCNTTSNRCYSHKIWLQCFSKKNITYRSYVLYIICCRWILERHWHAVSYLLE